MRPSTQRCWSVTTNDQGPSHAQGRSRIGGRVDGSAHARTLTLTEACSHCLRGSAGARCSGATDRRAVGGHSRARPSRSTNRQEGRQGVLRPGMGRGRVTETLMVETSHARCDHSGGARLATGYEQIVGASAFTTCFNVFEAALAVVREKDLSAVRRTPDRAGHRSAAGRRDQGLCPLRRSFTPSQHRERFGAGRRGLNMGDCLSYGAAERPAGPLDLCWRRTSREPTSTTTRDFLPNNVSARVR